LPPLLLLAVLWAPETVLSGVVLRGVAAEDADAVIAWLRLGVGSPLRRSPGAVAAALESRYRMLGYPAASASAALGDGVLELAVDEGRLAQVELEGLAQRAAARALAACGPRPGQALRDRHLWEPFACLDEASQGALAPDAPAYRIGRTPEGVRLVLRVRTLPGSVAVRPRGGPGVAGAFNRVDGLNLGLGVDARLHDVQSWNHPRVYARAAYGLAGRRLAWAAGLTRSFGRDGALQLGYEAHDLTDTDDHFRSVGLEDGGGRRLLHSANALDFHRRRGHEAWARGRLGGRGQAVLAFRSDRYSSLSVATADPPVRQTPPHPNPAVEEGRMRSLLAVARWSSRGELFPDPDAERAALPLRSVYGLNVAPLEALRAEAAFEAGGRALGGEFDFERLIVLLRARRAAAMNVLQARVLLGLAHGEPPRPKRFFLGGAGTLRGYEEKRFEGTRMLLGTLEWSLAPIAGAPALVPFADVGRADRGRTPTSGWRAGAGAGLRWPARGVGFVRLDVALALNPPFGEGRSPRATVQVRLPF
jgi:hypothetical protein